MFWKLIINLQMLFAACDLRAVTPLALVLLFIQGLFSVLERFMSTE